MRSSVLLIVAVVAVLAACAAASGTQQLDPSWRGWCTPDANADKQKMEQAYNEVIRYLKEEKGKDAHDLTERTGFYSFEPIEWKMALLMRWLENDVDYPKFEKCSDSESAFGFKSGVRGGFLSFMSTSYVPPAHSPYGASQEVDHSICSPDEPCCIPKPQGWWPWRGYGRSWGRFAQELQRLCSPVYVAKAEDCKELEVCGAEGSSDATCQCLPIGEGHDNDIRQYGGSASDCRKIFNHDSGHWDIFQMVTMAANNAKRGKTESKCGPLFDDYQGDYMFEWSAKGPHMIDSAPGVVPHISPYFDAGGRW